MIAGSSGRAAAARRLSCGELRAACKAKAAPLIVNVGGASFHDGTPIQAQHVVASLERVRSQTSSLRSLFKQLRFDVVGDLDIRVGLPRGMQHETLRHLLAHTVAAIRNQASGCGAFRRTLTAALEERFEAHAGHPRGDLGSTLCA